MTKIVADELCSLLDAVDSESIAREFRISINNGKHDFESHTKVAVRKGLDASSSLAELGDKTAVDDSLEHMPKSRFSELTNDRDYCAVVRLLFAVLHTLQLYHQRAVQRKRLERLTRGVGAADAINLELTRSVVVSDEFVGDDKDIYEIDSDGGGLELHCAARVDGEHKHLLGAAEKAIPTKARNSTTYKTMSRSSQTSTRSSRRLTVRTRATSGSVRSSAATMTSSRCCTQTLDSSSKKSSKSLKSALLLLEVLSQEIPLTNRHGRFVMSESS